jgi:hypothetical protein
LFALHQFVEDLSVNADQMARFMCLFADLQKQNIIRYIDFCGRLYLRGDLT